ncbi:MAG: UbiA-like protein EboC [Cellulophaga sp.]
MNAKLKGYLKLMRLANLPTAAADIFAGVAISSAFFHANITELDVTSLLNIAYLVLASVSLYAGGVVLNDVFDYKLDKVERPERPIPSGLIPLKRAAAFGAILLFIGILLAFVVTIISGSIAVILAGTILLYNAFSKNNSILGPLNMGICRGLNLLLGISILGEITNWGYVGIPIIYIAAITLISRGEVHGDNKKHIIFAGFLYAFVIISVIGLMVINNLNLLHSIPFLILFVVLIYKPLLGAYKLNSPENIKKAVIGGVLSLIVLDASIAVGFSQWYVGLAILALLPLSKMLSKLFAVT